jgi:hypothetical protein
MATNGGHFSYQLSTKGYTDSVSLGITYFGNEEGLKTFKILIDGEILLQTNLAGKWKKSQLMQVEYPIPTRMLAGKEKITLTFSALPGHSTGSIYYIRLLNGKRVDPIHVYAFRATDWGVCDANRASSTAFTYDTSANTFTIKSSGNNNS